MELVDVVKSCKLDDRYRSVLVNGWSSSMVDMPKTDFCFLDADEIVFARKACQMAPELDSILLETADTIKHNPALRALAWHAYYQLIKCTSISYGNWPLLTGVLGDKFGVFYLLIALSVVPEAIKSYQARNIPQDIIDNTLLEIKGFCNNHQMAYQCPGLLTDQLGWLRVYQHGRIFRLGRLEFKLEPFTRNLHVYRHRETMAKIILAADGVDYNKQGFVDGVGDVFDKEEKWTSQFIKTETTVTGNPISPTGMAVNKTITLELTEWEDILPYGSWVMDMHIPPGGGMGVDVCEASLRKALEFFPMYFPDYPMCAFSCGASWIFDPALEQKLPESNLAKFMRELYLYPIASSGKDAIFFVFGKKIDEMECPPRNTSLQRVLLDSLEAGEPLHAGGMLFFSEDIEKWGTQVYRKRVSYLLES